MKNIYKLVNKIQNINNTFAITRLLIILVCNYTEILGSDTYVLTCKKHKYALQNQVNTVVKM